MLLIFYNTFKQSLQKTIRETVNMDSKLQSINLNILEEKTITLFNGVEVRIGSHLLISF